jgi:peptidoglycan/xylan/chitin deacetylase (PgdA/CDA1 family)
VSPRPGAAGPEDTCHSPTAWPVRRVTVQIGTQLAACAPTGPDGRGDEDVSILCYHTVDPTWRSGLSMDVPAFRSHCAWLARNRQVVDLDTAVALMDRRGALPRGVSCLTFDDGLDGLYEYALPVLREYRLPATVFVVARTLVGDPTVDWIDDPPAHPLGTLSLEQLQEMVESGFDVASHSHAHRVLTDLDADACHEDLRTSREVLEGLLSRPIRFLAYPRGAHDVEVREATERAGYTYAFGLPERHEPVGPFSLPRAGVWRHNGVASVRVKSARRYVAARTRLHPIAGVVHRLSSTGPAPPPPPKVGQLGG